MKRFFSYLCVFFLLASLILGLVVYNSKSAPFERTFFRASIILMAVFGLLSRRFTNKQVRDPKENATAPEEPPEPVVKYRHISFRTAGVTFKNDDGSERQRILRHIKFKDEPYVSKGGVVETSIKEVDYSGAPAFAVSLNGYQIGFVPKDKIPDVQEAMEHDDVCVSAVEIIGGGIRDGERMPYGCEITLRYTI